MFDNLPAPSVPGGMIFTGNPLWVDYTDILDDDPEVTGYPFIIKRAGRQIFEGRFNTPLHLNVAPIIRAGVTPLHEPDESDYRVGPFYSIEDEDQMQDRLFELDFNGGLIKRAVYALPGGVSRQTADIMPAGTNIFTSRFLTGGNRFLSVRSAGIDLVVRETELAPLYFINDETEITVDVGAEGIPGVEFAIDKGIWAFDPAELRKVFAGDRNRICNVINITFNEGRPCRLIIEESRPDPRLCCLKFRNSFGVFEKLEVIGPESTGWDGGDDSEDETTRYIPGYDDFEQIRERGQLRRSWRLSTGTISADRVRLALDAIASDEVYLMEAGADPVRVNIEVEELELDEHPRQPQRLVMAARESFAESHIQPTTEWAGQSQGYKVFGSAFDDNFN